MLVHFCHYAERLFWYFILFYSTLFHGSVVQLFFSCNISDIVTISRLSLFFLVLSNKDKLLHFDKKHRLVLVSQAKGSGSPKRVGIPITYREERGGGVACWWLSEQQRQLRLADGLISGARVLITNTWRTSCCREAGCGLAGVAGCSARVGVHAIWVLLSLFTLCQRLNSLVLIVIKAIQHSLLHTYIKISIMS